jgi:HlyD family secretion protein
MFVDYIFTKYLTGIVYMDRILEKKKWPPKRVITYSLSGLFALIVIYNLLFGDTSSKLNVETEKITISTVTKGPFKEYIPITGNVIPIKTVYLDAVEGGRVEKLFLEAGTMVEQGDEILQLGNTNLLMDIMFREAELFEQSNNLRNTRLAMEQNRLNLKSELINLDFQQKMLERDFHQKKELLKENLISQLEFEQSRDEHEYNMKRRELAIESYKQDSLFRKIQISQLEASLKRMQNNLGLIKSKLENLTIRAPISGHLTSLNAEIGESKSRGERLGQVDVLEGFKVRAAVDEYHLSRIQRKLEGEFDFAGSTHKIVVDKIFPEIRDGRFNIDLIFSDSEPEGITRGLTSHIRLELGNLSDAILLPRGGFYQKTGGQWVYVLDEGGDFASKRDIRLGMQNPQMFEVLEGLEPGEKVITSSYESFGDNDILVLTED